MRTGILWYAALAAVGAAQGPPTDETQPVFRTRARIVEVTLQATRSDGSAVEDLTPGDLRLFDNNREQAIATFERVRASAVETRRAGQAEPLGRGANRLSILLLDALNTNWSDQIYAHCAAARALGQIPPGERIAIFVLGDDLRLLHDFSSDSASLKALVERFSGAAPRGKLDPVANPLAAEFSYSDLLRSKEPSSGPWAAIQQRQRILETLDALRAIARLVKGVPGQKNLLWLSAAFPLSLGGPGALGAESFHDDASLTTRELNAANVTIYPIDARGLSASSRAYINIGTMEELAEQTGGKAYYNSNDLASLVRSALEDSRKGYVLTYAPSDLQDDGKFHGIRLRAARRGVQLRYRPGYYADAQHATGR
jgi:VWFA-related protein